MTCKTFQMVRVRMDEASRQALHNTASNSAALTFQDLLDTSRYGAASDYCALSIFYRGKSLCIQITTDAAPPITYTAVIPRQDKFEFSSVLFVAQ